MVLKFISRPMLTLFALGFGAVALLNACGGAKPTAPATEAAAALPTTQASSTPQPSSTSAATKAPNPSRTTKPTTTPKPSVTPKSTTVLSSDLSSVIDQAVMAAGVSALAVAPLGIADTFSPDQGVYHAVLHIQDAPQGAKFKATWTAVDTGGALAANTNLGSYELTEDGTRYLDFNYRPNSGHMPVGTYQVDIDLNGKPARTLNFTIDANAPVITPEALASNLCPPLALPTETPPSFEIGVTMAPKTQGDNFEPVNPGRVFGPKDVFHAVVNVQDAPDKTRFKAVWYAEDVGSAAPCNFQLNEGQLTSGGSRNLDFYISPGSEWPVGQYRVEVYVNDVLTIATTFSVVANPSAAATSAAVPTEATGTPASSTSSSAVVYPAQVNYQHTGRSCFSNDTAAPVTCDPPGLDILSAAVTRPSADGPVTIVLELAGGASVKATSLWVMGYAFDLDRDISTGLQRVYPSNHGIGPEFTLTYGEVNGEVRQLVQRYAADGTETDGDTSLAKWSWLDDNHLQVVVDPSLIPVERFNLVGDLTVQTMFDHFVEDGYLMFPEGQAGHK